MRTIAILFLVAIILFVVTRLREWNNRRPFWPAWVRDGATIVKCLVFSIWGMAKEDSWAPRK